MARLFLTAVVACMAPSVLAQEEQQVQQVTVPGDMACTEGPRAKEWGAVKRRFRSLFDGASGPFQPVKPEALVATLKDSIADVEAVRGLSTDADAVNECGFGKLFIQLLSLVTVEDPMGIAQYFQEHQAISSPVLTMLLDIPWIAMAQSGWPFFGVMAQINYQKSMLLSPVLNLEAVDGLADEAVKAFFDVMQEARGNGDMLSMATASGMYLRNIPTGSPYASLTAMATQTAISMDIQERLKGIETLQQLVKQAMTTPAELDIALTMRWPLWGFLHVCVDVFAEPN